MMNEERRLFLKYALGSSAVGLAAGAGILSFPAWAVPDVSQWPKDAFSKKENAPAIQALYGQTPTTTDKIKLRVPTIAQNGAVVPVTVESSLPKVTSISLMVSENPFSLVASFKIPEGTLPFVSNRLKMAKTSDVIALVMSDGKLYSASKRVKVTVGGCGG